MKAESVFDRALRRVKRNKDGSLPLDELEAEIAKELGDDPEEKSKRAKRIINERTKPGKTVHRGQLSLPGFDPFPYEPYRLIKDSDRENGIEEERSSPEYRQARLDRMNRNIARSMARAKREADSLPEFRRWKDEHILSGAPQSEMTWDRFVKEKGFWQERPLPFTDPLGGDDEE